MIVSTSVKLYARMTKQEYATWVDRLMTFWVEPAAHGLYASVGRVAHAQRGRQPHSPRVWAQELGSLFAHGGFERRHDVARERCVAEGVPVLVREEGQRPALFPMRGPPELDVAQPSRCVIGRVVVRQDDRLGAVARSPLVTLGALWAESRVVAFFHGAERVLGWVQVRAAADAVADGGPIEPIVLVHVAVQFGRLPFARSYAKVDDHPCRDHEARPLVEGPLSALDHRRAGAREFQALEHHRRRDWLDAFWPQLLYAEAAYEAPNHASQRLSHCTRRRELHVA